MGDRRVRPDRARRLLLAGSLCVLLVVAACTRSGSAVIAPYRSPALNGLTAAVVRADGSDVLALSPNGSSVAISDPAHGVCVRPVRSTTGMVCANLTLTGHLQMTAAFSPDGQRVAVGRDVATRGRGMVWLLDVHTGTASPVPAIDAAPALSTPAVKPDGSSAGAPSGSAYIGMIWNRASGHLLLMSDSFEAAGATSRVVDVDPRSLIPRVVALATGPYEFQSGYLAGGGSKVIFTVYRGDQVPPNLVVVDLNSGARREFGPLGPSGTQLAPLAVSPDGRQAIVGSSTFGPAGPPHLLDLRTGALTVIPGVTGNSAAAGYSPNGAQLALVTQSAGALEMWVAPRRGARARSLSVLPSAFVAGSRLTWSGLNTLSMSSPSELPAGAIVGWALSSP